MSLGLAVVLAVLVILGYWTLLLAAVWLGHRITMAALLAQLGTTDPDELLRIVTDWIRGYRKP